MTWVFDGIEAVRCGQERARIMEAIIARYISAERIYSRLGDWTTCTTVDPALDRDENLLAAAKAVYAKAENQAAPAAWITGTLPNFDSVFIPHACSPSGEPAARK